MIILRVKYVWSCYNNCYSALQLKRATVTNLKKKKKIEMERLLDLDFLCLLSEQGFREPIGDALRT